MDGMRGHFAIGQKVWFAEEKPPYIVKAVGKRFAVLTRRGRYEGRRELFYTIVDFETEMRGPNDLVFNLWDVGKQKDIEAMLNCMETGRFEDGEECEIELSRRRSIPVRFAAEPTHAS